MLQVSVTVECHAFVGRLCAEPAALDLSRRYAVSPRCRAKVPTWWSAVSDQRAGKRSQNALSQVSLATAVRRVQGSSRGSSVSSVM